MNIMVDLNVLLDFVQKREPHFQYSAIVISEILSKKVNGLLPAHALTTVHYLISKYDNQTRANRIIDWLLSNFAVVANDKPSFVQARNLQFDDFEDAVVSTLAKSSNCSHIITRNISDFEKSPIPAITPEEFVRRYV